MPEKGRQQQAGAAVKRRLVADVGANFGYYSLYAAAHGCRYFVRSLAWDCLFIVAWRRGDKSSRELLG